MNWLEKISWKPKHEKDKKHIYLWHASPEHHNTLSARSSIGKDNYSYRGLYFTPSFQSLIKDWAPYILGKKIDREHSHSNTPNYTYKSLFIHKVSVPSWVLKEAHQRQQEVFNLEESSGEASLGFWGWGEQIFIPEELLDNLSIVDIKKYSSDDFQDLYGDYNKHRNNVIPSFNDPAWNWVSPSGTTRDDIIKKRKDEADKRPRITVQDEEKRRKEQDNL